MYILTKSNIIDKICEIIKKNNILFNSFECVYLFGSVLDAKKIPNDIDMLFIYSIYSSKIIGDLRHISTMLEEEIGLPIDVTVLSIQEEMETGFLNRISNSCLKVK